MSTRSQCSPAASWSAITGVLLCVCALLPAADLFSPGWSLLVLLAWPAVGLAAAALLTTCRDA